MRVFLLLSLVCAVATSLAGEPQLQVTVQQLLATPEKFVGKRVDVTGWYLAVHEDSNLFASERAVDGNLDHSIWLEPDFGDPRSHRRRPPGVAEARRVENRGVRVIGTFHYQPQPYLGKSVPYARRFQGFGSYRLNKRAILDITYIQSAH